MKRSRRRLFGVTWAVGIPQSGKTTISVARAIARAEERGVPLLAIDSARVDQLAGLPEAPSAAEVVRALYRERRSCRFTPTTLEELEQALLAVRRGKNVVVLVDEAHYWLSAHTRGTSSELVHLLRESQHARADVFLTTQHLTGDIPQAALSCTSSVIVLRCTAPRVLELLERNWGVPRERAQSLPQFHYLELPLGF